jgi:hypothetical protein
MAEPLINPPPRNSINVHVMELIRVTIARGAQGREEKTTRVAALALE